LADGLPSSPPPGGRHTKGMCHLLSQPGYARFLTEDARGLRIDRAKGKAEERLDGKYALVTNELELPAEELVRGYRDMWRAERAFRSMKSLLDIEPVHHRTEERIVAHVHLCVLAYLLCRVAEARAGASWERLWEQLDEISLTRLETKRATVLQTKRLTAAEQDLFKRCRVVPPPRILSIE